MAKGRIACLALCALAVLTANAAMAAGNADDIAAAAQSFLDTLDTEQRKLVSLPMDTKDRAKWSNLPIIMVRPAGVLVGDMSDTQKRAAHALMRATMSSQGYAKFAGIMLLEDLLHKMESQRLAKGPPPENAAMARAFVATRDFGNYAIAVFGTPGDPNWGWKIAGHHAAANFTISDGRVAFTPTFLGSSPREVESGRYAGIMALAHEGARGIALMESLDTAQREKATMAAEAANDVFEGPGRRRSLAKYEGLPAADMTDAQWHLLRRLVAEYLHNVDHDAAHAQMQAITEAGWDKLWFSWRGPVDIDGEFYYRVHGPRILIEYNRQNANHDHMIVRDPTNDYGEDWLGKHIEEHHPSMEEAMETARRRAAEAAGK